jgi:cytochrome c556
MPRRQTLTIVAILAAGLAGAAAAHEHATGIAAERMAVMDTMGKATKAIAGLIKRGEAPARVLPHAEKIREASAHVAHLFPPGSGTGVTDAAPAIWQRWPEFEAKAAALATESDDLVAAARAGNAAVLRERFGALTDGCAACHKPFRIKR